MKTIIQADVTAIKRSQINFAPYNPKKHTDAAIKQQLKNIKRVGYLGGIVWNKTTRNLVSGHKRVMAFDVFYKYDGTHKTDYEIKVGVVEMDIKTEKEQNVFMDNKSTNTEQDYELLSALLPDIDYNNAGISYEDYENLLPLIIDNTDIEIDTINVEDLSPQKHSKEEIKKLKADIQEKSQQNHQDLCAYVTLSFSKFEEKAIFCELMSCDPYNTTYIKGEDVLKLIE